jgi:hypothetical protein
VIARVFQKPGEVPPAARKHRLGALSSTTGTAAGDSCFSDSTSASIGGASSSSTPGPLFASAAAAVANAGAADGDTSSYCGGAANHGNLVTGRELVPCFSTATINGPLVAAALGIGQPYNAAPLPFEQQPPPPAFLPSLRSLQDNLQLPPFLSAGGLGGGGALHWLPAGGMEVKVEGRSAPPQMAVGPGQLDGAFGWSF